MQPIHRKLIDTTIKIFYSYIIVVALFQDKKIILWGKKKKKEKKGQIWDFLDDRVTYLFIYLFWEMSERLKYKICMGSSLLN